MKTILLLRHAKSDWGNGLSDFDRPLAQRGLRDAPLIGKVLANFDATPDVILASPAKRAAQTAELVAEAAAFQGEIQWIEEFYMADSETLVNALPPLPETANSVMLVGHNPTMQDTVSEMLTGGEEWSRDIFIQMPTGGLVCMDIHVESWRKVSPGGAVLRWMLIPRLLKAILD